MKYLNATRENKNFYVKEKLLYNINSSLPIADLSDGKYLDDSDQKDKMKEIVEYFASGARVTIECNGERCIQFFGNDGKKIAETFCHRGQNKDNVSILPIDHGVFTSQYLGRRMVYMFVDYKNDSRFMDHNFNNVYKSVETQIEAKGKRGSQLSRSEKFRQAIANIRREEARERRA